MSATDGIKTTSPAAIPISGAQSYLDPLVRGKIPVGIHIMGWHGDPEHRDPRAPYDSADPATVARQAAEILDDWKFDFVVMDWYGPARGRIDISLALWRRECERRGAWFAVSIDSQAVSKRADKSLPGQQELLNLLQYIEAFFSHSDGYFRGSDGRPVVFEFGMETLAGPDAINWNEICARYPEWHFIHRNIGGFGVIGSGSYAWIDDGEAYLTDYYKRALAPSQDKFCFGSWFKGFDNRRVDGTGKIIVPEQAVWPGKAVKRFGDDTGSLFLRTVELTNQFVQAGGKLAGVIFNTYNDWQEGTACEGGIDHNCKGAIGGNRNVIASSSIVAKPMFKAIEIL